MRKADIVIGIDPDTERNGYAMLDVDTSKVNVTTASLPVLLELVEAVQASALAAGKRLKVYVEAGWLNTPNWHLSYRDTRQMAAAKGKALGRNMQRGIDIIELLMHRGIDVEGVAPLRKMWKGNDRKITHDELVRIVGPIKHTNQEGRDAVMIAWVYSGKTPTKKRDITRRRGG